MKSEPVNYYFENFCFDAENEELLKNGCPVSLTSKAVNVLQILLQNHGRFVRKEEIIERVWCDRFVEESNLTQHVYILRKTLGQTASGAPFIETVTKKGYRFTVAVTKRRAEILPQNFQLYAGKRRVIFNENHVFQENTVHQIEPSRVQGYRFGDYKLDIQRRMLYRENQPVTVPAKVFDTLLFLVENAGQLVKKDALMDKIWQERFVEENNLSQKIFILRRVLGDKKDEHQYIVTVPGKGYVFVAPVVKCSNETFSGAAVKESFSAPAAIPKSTPVIAVLPFKVFALNESLIKEEILAIGLADALISQLSRCKDLVVRPTSSVIKYHNQDWDVVSVSCSLQATHLIEGIIQYFETKLKISAQLFDLEKGRIIWADDFVIASSADIPELQNHISNLVSKALAHKLNLEIPLPSALPKDFEAFQEYIKGKFHWNTRTIQGLKKGIKHVQNALAIEPTYAMAYVGLADCYNLLAGQHSFLSPKNAFPKARAASETALEISDGNLAEAYASLAFTTFHFDWNRPLARQYFLRAIELKPNYATSHQWFGEALAAEKRFDEAISELKKAQELDPLSLPISADLAEVYLFAGNYGESLSLLEQILEINPQFIRALYLLGLLYEQKRQFDRAVEILQGAVEIAPDEPALLAELGFALAASGNADEARSIIGKLQKMGEKRYLSGFFPAIIYLALNQIDEVFKWLETAYQNRDVWLVWIDVFPKLQVLRGEQRFVSLAAKIKNSF